MIALVQNTTSAKKLRKNLLCLVFLWLMESVATAQNLVPGIQVLPSSNVEVGEEVFFSGAGTTYDGDATLFARARYEWNFGDGYYLAYDPNNSLITRQGLAATHYYMKPGDFTVQLQVKIFPGWDFDGTPIDETSTSSSNVTIGIGSKTFKIETGKNYQPGMYGNIYDALDDDVLRRMSGTIESYDPQTGDLVVNVTSQSGYNGFTCNSWTLAFEKLPIAVKTTTTIVHVTGETPIAGFEIQRAPFHNRLAQYIYVQVPEAYRGSETSLRVTLEGAKGSKSTLLSKNNLASEERVFLDHKPLEQDQYVVIAELLNTKGERIRGCLWRDKFSKSYSGIPKIGIDENNSFRVDGQLFFPLTSFLLDKSKMDKYLSGGSVNGGYLEGYYPSHTPDTWADYLNELTNRNKIGIGPGKGTFEPPIAPDEVQRWKFNHNLNVMNEYITKNKSKTSLFAWGWQDEPNLGARHSKVYPPVLAAWAYISHLNDPQHLSFNNLYGLDWSKYYGTAPTMYDYLGSAKDFGGKKWMQDVIKFDDHVNYYRLHVAHNFVDMGPYAAYLDLMDRARSNNKDLAPIFPSLMPCNGQTDHPELVHTAEQIYMEAWMNVVHGAKGISWFPYHWPETIRWDAMKKFNEQVTALAPVILGPEPLRMVTDSANESLNRVDTLIREHNGSIYVFAVRITEPDPITAQTYTNLGMPVGIVSKYTAIEPESITVDFSVNSLTGNTVAEVLDEGRQVSLIEGRFQDAFGRNAVHIYKISLGPSKGPGAVQDLRIAQ